MMEKSNSKFNRLIGLRCKLVVQEPGDREPKALHGVVEDIGNGMILFRSERGLGSFNLAYVIAVKPTEGQQ